MSIALHRLSTPELVEISPDYKVVWVHTCNAGAASDAAIVRHSSASG